MRLDGLGLQSYWTDEQFTVRQVSGSFDQLWTIGQTEVHTPFYAVLCWLWLGLGSAEPHWMRLLNAVAGCASVLVVWWAMGRTRLPRMARVLLCAATAGNGAGILYGQDVRPYGLLWLASVGLMGATLQDVCPRNEGWRWWPGWTAWAVLASLSHLFGLVLAASSAVVLVGSRRVSKPSAAAALGVASLPQTIWILHGLFFVPGFAEGAKFTSPGWREIGVWLTSTFAADGLTAQSGGFEWSSPALLLGVVALLLVGAAQRLSSRGLPPSSPSDRTLQTAAATMLATALLMAVGVFLTSQVVPLWTTRNMLAASPALAWGLMLAALWLPVDRRTRSWVALLLAVALMTTLAGVREEVRRPYKTDFLGVALKVMEERRRDPSIRLIGNIGPSWLVGAPASVLADPDAEILLTPTATVGRHRFPAGATARPGKTIYVFYLSISAPIGTADQYVINLAGPNCKAVPATGLVYVRCG